MKDAPKNTKSRLYKGIKDGVGALNADPVIRRKIINMMSYFEKEESGNTERFLSTNKVPDKPFVRDEASASAIPRTEDGTIVIVPDKMTNKLRLYIDVAKIEKKINQGEFAFLFLVYVNQRGKYSSPLRLVF